MKRLIFGKKTLSAAIVSASLICVKQGVHWHLSVWTEQKTKWAFLPEAAPSAAVKNKLLQLCLEEQHRVFSCTSAIPNFLRVHFFFERCNT